MRSHCRHTRLAGAGRARSRLGRGAGGSTGSHALRRGTALEGSVPGSGPGYCRDRGGPHRGALPARASPGVHRMVVRDQPAALSAPAVVDRRGQRGTDRQGTGRFHSEGFLSSRLSHRLHLFHPRRGTGIAGHTRPAGGLPGALRARDSHDQENRGPLRFLPGPRADLADRRSGPTAHGGVHRHAAHDGSDLTADQLRGLIACHLDDRAGAVDQRFAVLQPEARAKRASPLELAR